jgi:hypothetical protein
MARTISPCELLLLRPKAHQALPKIMLSMLQCWVILVACIASATAGSLCIKASNVYQQLVPSILMFVFFVVAVAGFPFAFSRIDLGTAYAGMLKKENLLSRSLSFSSNGRLLILLLQFGLELVQFRQLLLVYSTFRKRRHLSRFAESLSLLLVSSCSIFQKQARWV